MKLAVITFTNGQRAKWLELTSKSISDCLPPDSEHIILQCKSPKDLEPMRLECLKIAKYITFVDDDDLVVNNSLINCLNVLETTNVGVAFTDEQQVDTLGNPLSTDLIIRSGITYRDVSKHPTFIHHLAMINTQAVPSEIITYSNEIGIGAEWLIKASAALTNKAIHVKQIGYQWRQHDSSHHNSNQWVNGYTSSMTKLRNCLQKYCEPITKIIPCSKIL